MQKFNEIYNENYSWVLNLIKSKTTNCPESEEMTNDIFMKVHENLPIFDADKCKTGLVGWIRSFTFNKIIDYYRSNKSKNDVLSMQDFTDQDGKEIFSIKDGVDIEADYCRNELIDNAKNVIKMFPNPYKTVATLFYVKDYSYDEIEKQTGISVSTIKCQLNRIRKKLQSEVEVSI